MSRHGSLSAAKRHNFDPQRTSVASRVSFNEDSMAVGKMLKKQPVKVFSPILSGGGNTPDKEGSLLMMSTDSFSSKRRDRFQAKRNSEVSPER